VSNTPQDESLLLERNRKSRTAPKTPEAMDELIAQVEDILKGKCYKYLSPELIPHPPYVVEALAA